MFKNYVRRQQRKAAAIHFGPCHRLTTDRLLLSGVALSLLATVMTGSFK